VAAGAESRRGFRGFDHRQGGTRGASEAGLSAGDDAFFDLEAGAKVRTFSDRGKTSLALDVEGRPSRR
jgi:hypothetical protein